MKILGIVAEYDPFHNGHMRHISGAKKAVSPDLTYIVLSPCVKQRGELSLLSPSDRARCALEAGADAVFSLPVIWTARDAEHYALGAVSLLGSLGATHLAFGAETADIDLLQAAAAMLENPGAVFHEVLKRALYAGTGYPAAVSAALSSVLPEASGLLDQPNNILAVCYLRAVLRLNLQLTPVIISRACGYHAPGINPEAPSASAIRESLSRGNYAAAFGALPSFTAELLRKRYLEGRIPDRTVLDSLLIARLRSMDENEYRLLPDLSEGMENALRSAAETASSCTELISALTSRRYPASRISRLCACALLGITCHHTENEPLPGKAFLLGLRNRPETTAMWKDLPIPVISSFTEWKKAANPADLAAWRLGAQCCRFPDTLPFSEKMVIV